MICLVSIGVLGWGAQPAGAHTESDVVAVPATGEATVTFRPTHGCGDASTTEVSVRAPVEGATAAAVEGWVEASRPDGEGNTILEWTGGLLPTDQAGAFPITFTVPDAPGDLLTFPAVQICEDGAELAWIDGDPEGEYPAPRLLVLPPGSEPAATTGDVPADAPGRDQLTEIVDVDNPATEGDEAATTTAPPEAPTEPAAPSTTEATDLAPSTQSAAADDGTDEDDGGGGASAVAIGAIVVGALAVTAYMVLRRRSSEP